MSKRYKRAIIPTSTQKRSEEEFKEVFWKIIKRELELEYGKIIEKEDSYATKV
jgi:hypothetical protein